MYEVLASVLFFFGIVFVVDSVGKILSVVYSFVHHQATLVFADLVANLIGSLIFSWLIHVSFWLVSCVRNQASFRFADFTAYVINKL